LKMLIKSKDLVDEFDPTEHPFANQIALIDTAIRDCRACRTRYEGHRSGAVYGNNDSQTDGNSDATAIEEDLYDNFRIRETLDPLGLPQVTLSSGKTYTQVPSRYATCYKLISIYSHPNKSDIPGAANLGESTDTRYGIPGQAPHGSLRQHTRRANADHQKAKRDDKVNRRPFQDVYDDKENQDPYPQRRGRRRERGFVRPNNPEPFVDEYGNIVNLMDTQIQFPPGLFSGPSFADSGILSRSDASYEVPIHPGQLAAEQQYAEHLARERAYDNRGGNGNTIRDHQNRGRVASPSIILARQSAQDSLIGTNNLEILRTLDAGGIPLRFNGTARDPQDQLKSQPQNNMRRERIRIGQRADREYARYLDELNEESRRRGQTVLEGDRLSGHAQMQVRFNIQPPSPSQASAMAATEARSQEETDWADLKTSASMLNHQVHLANPAVLDPVTAASSNSSHFLGHHTAASSRPASQSSDIMDLPTGRLSEPPRDRPTFLSPLLGNGIGGLANQNALDLNAVRRRFGLQHQADVPGAATRSSSTHSSRADESCSGDSAGPGNYVNRPSRLLGNMDRDAPTPSSKDSRGTSPNLTAPHRSLSGFGP
jgi:hypothetical protein